MADKNLGPFKRWFWQPPRPHGETIDDRTVSFLELFYDLVYVAVIGQAAQHLAEHVTTRGAAEFAVVFAAIWIAWVNGTLYIESHGRDDGRTRTIVFTQMGVLALLAVFTEDAADGSGATFAIVYAVYLAILTGLFATVRRQERAGQLEFVSQTGRYVTGMAVAVVALLASAPLPSGPRLIGWGVLATAWCVGMLVAGRSRVGLNRGVPPTESLIERFGLFTIIVLGEVIFGVVDGLSAVDRNAQTIATGMVALCIGLGFWWIYFDLVGRRLPRNDGPAVANWLLSHLPITMSITAAGAAMVSLIEHAHDARTPAPTAWLLAGALAVGLVAHAVAQRTLDDARRLAAVYQPVSVGMGAGAVVALGVAWTRPAPWLFALLLVAILSVLWLFAVSRFMRANAWSDDQARAD